MDKKDEKTFTDLFSNSKDESEVTTKTFSDILNSSINNDEVTQEKETETPITFDNLFDKIPTKETTQSDSFIPIEENVNINNDTEKNEEEYNFNSIFSIKEAEVTKNIDNPESNDYMEPKTKTEILEEDTTKEQLNTETTMFNPFLEVSNEEKKESNPKKEPDKNEKLEKKESFEEFNPFFSSDTSTEKNTDEEKEQQEQKISISEETTKNNDFDFSINPFINNTEEISTIKEEQKIEENPFFITNSNNTEKNVEIENQSQNINIENTNNKKETQIKEEYLPKSTSPFFEEEKKSEENPFFQNKLNLIENQEPNKPSANIDTTKAKHYNVKIVKKKEPLIKFILGVLSYALFIWLLLIGVTLLIYVLDIKIRAAKGDYSSPKFNAYVVLTGSMLPEIQVYDVVVTKRVEAKELKEGDVITFASADSRFLGTIITHRIIKKNPPTDDKEGYTFQTRGDNNNVADSALVPENNIYGKVILKIPKLGYLQEFLATDGGWIIVILIPCLTVISYDIVKLIKGLKRKKYKNIKVQK